MQKEKKSKNKKTEALKHYLRGAKHWRTKANYVSDQIIKLRSECEKMTSTLSNIPPTLDGYTDHRQQKYDEMIDKEREYEECVRKCNERVEEIQRFIDKLYKYEEREACELHYIYFEDWQTAALKMDFSVRRVLDFHGDALLHLLEIHKEIVENGGEPLF